jgi:hypothetical protein
MVIARKIAKHVSEMAPPVKTTFPSLPIHMFAAKVDSSFPPLQQRRLDADLGKTMIPFQGCH